MESNILSRNFAASVSVVWVDQVLVLVNGIWDMESPIPINAMYDGIGRLVVEAHAAI